MSANFSFNMITDPKDPNFIYSLWHPQFTTRGVVAAQHKYQPSMPSTTHSTSGDPTSMNIMDVTTTLQGIPQLNTQANVAGKNQIMAHTLLQAALTKSQDKKTPFGIVQALVPDDVAKSAAQNIDTTTAITAAETASGGQISQSQADGIALLSNPNITFGSAAVKTSFNNGQISSNITFDLSVLAQTMSLTISAATKTSVNISALGSQNRIPSPINGPSDTVMNALTTLNSLTGNRRPTTVFSPNASGYTGFKQDTKNWNGAIQIVNTNSDSEASQLIGTPAPNLGSGAGSIAPPSGGGSGTTSANAQKVVNFATSQLGVPYVYGGEDPGHDFDCSGLTQAAFHSVGITLPRVAQAQYDQTPKVPKGGDLLPADLVFFSSGGSNPAGNIGHVGIYIGNGKMIDAPHTGASVRIENYNWTGSEFYFGATRPIPATIVAPHI